ncbi:calcium and integrin-binding family member 2-like [Sycon ciliatum]|uniref:calcium and integrin-binding family member 2-like n=1 Tax=Sycon ciliatum TaxID=27933 RepID=UPI0020AA9C75|eukprot:scpid64979/ scgid6380/ Calcium and integrin-binding family member 2; Kinase-interacting protein 2
MGQSKSVFSQEELEEYQDLTYFSKAEIVHAFERFQALDPDHVRQNRHASIRLATVLAHFPEIRVNPFGERICKLFSSDGEGNLTFEDFLDMMSVFSENADKDVKTEWAFMIYDFNNDNVIDRSDLTTLLSKLCGAESRAPPEEQISEETMKEVIDKIISEGDLDDDGMLSYPEFEHAILKSPDFFGTFRIRM